MTSTPEERRQLIATMREQRAEKDREYNEALELSARLKERTKLRREESNARIRKEVPIEVRKVNPVLAIGWIAVIILFIFGV